MKTAVYLRQSLDRDGNQLAVDRQRDACLELCERRGWTDTVLYVDNDTSASTGTRPAYADMAADIEAGALGAVVAYHLDRLHRQPRELEDFITLADEHRIKLATVTGDVDLSTDNGRLIARITGAVAKAEVERKSARQKAANAQRAKAGRAWVQRAFGYDGNEIVAHEAEAIRQGCAALLDGVSLRSIAAQWNAAGLATVNGAPWNGSTVRQVLSNCRNAGRQKYNARQALAEARKTGTPLQRYSAGVLEGVETSWPAIVSRDVWEAVCSVLSDPSRHTGKTPGRVYLLSGLARCGECGHTVGTTLRTTKRGTKQPIYTCKQRGCQSVTRNLAAVDALVIDVVCRWLAQPDAAEVFAKPSVDIKALKQEADVLRQRIIQTKLDYDEDLIDARDRNRKLDKLDGQLRPIEAKLLGANTSRKLEKLAGNPKAREVFDTLPLDRKRAVIDTVCQVTIEKATQPGEHFNPERIRIERRGAQ